MTDVRAELGQLWWQVNREVHERVRHAFRGGELHPMGLMLLRQIHHEPGVTVSELSRRSGTAKSHVSKLVDHMVRQGLLEKRVDPDDQRLVRVHVTQRAIAIKAEMQARSLELWDEVIAAMPESDVEDVVRALQILLTALAKTRGRSEKE